MQLPANVFSVLAQVGKHQIFCGAEVAETKPDDA